MTFQSPGRFLLLSYVHSTGCQRPGAAPKRQHCMTEAALAGGLSGSRWKCRGQGSADPSQCLELSLTQTHALTNALHTYTDHMHTDTCIPHTHHTHTYRACSLSHTHTPTHPPAGGVSPGPLTMGCAHSTGLAELEYNLGLINI